MPSSQNKRTEQKPQWLKSSLAQGSSLFHWEHKINQKNLVTVCEEAKCPNKNECWNQNTATFMLLGDTCTRACRFCNVKTGDPKGMIDDLEPIRIAEMIQKMGLRYIVLTMVDRDDLEDGGAYHIAKVIEQIHRLNPEVKVEILAGDFGGNCTSIDKVLHAKIAVFAHNLETVKNLTPRVRDRRAGYEKSLDILRYAYENQKYPILTKSSLMLGLGESEEEIEQALRDLREAGVTLLTLGQYLRPTKKHIPLRRFVTPREFSDLAIVAKEIGFTQVVSGPLVRSSYHAKTLYQKG